MIMICHRAPYFEGCYHLPYRGVGGHCLDPPRLIRAGQCQSLWLALGLRKPIKGWVFYTQHQNNLCPAH